MEKIEAREFFSPMELFQFVDAEIRRVEFDVTLQAGDCYRVTVAALRRCSTLPHVVYRWIGAGQAEFKAGRCFSEHLTKRVLYIWDCAVRIWSDFCHVAEAGAAACEQKAIRVSCTFVPRSTTKVSPLCFSITSKVAHKLQSILARSLNGDANNVISPYVYTNITLQTVTKCRNFTQLLETRRLATAHISRVSIRLGQR